MRYYDALRLSPKLSLDAGDLKERFYERTRKWHPDRFSRRTPQRQKEALDMSAVLNDAFRTLRDPITRAEYFLEEIGMGPSKNPPPEMLEEVFELNMALEELRSGDESARPQLVEAHERFLKMRDEIDAGLAESFAEYDASEEAVWMAKIDAQGGYAPVQILPKIRSALDRRRYISNLLRDVEKELPVAFK